MSRDRTSKFQLMLVMTAVLAFMGINLIGCEPTEGTLTNDEWQEEADSSIFAVTGKVTLEGHTVPNAAVIAVDSDQQVIDETESNEFGEFVLLVGAYEMVTVLAGIEIDGVGFMASTESSIQNNELNLVLLAAPSGDSEERLNCWCVYSIWRFEWVCCEGSGHTRCGWYWGRGC